MQSSVHWVSKRVLCLAVVPVFLVACGCGSSGTPTPKAPPDEFVAYGLHAKSETQADLVAGKGRLMVVGKFWSSTQVADSVMVKIQSMNSRGEFMTNDSGTAGVRSVEDSKYVYDVEFDIPKRPGIYLIRVFYGKTVVDEVTFVVQKS